MEAEERPTKIRKVEHPSDSAQAEVCLSQERADGEFANMEQSAPPADEQIHHEADKASSELQEGANCDAASHPGTEQLSKNQQKKLKRQQQWDAGLEARKIKRKERTKASKQRKRDLLQEKILAGEDISQRPKVKATQLPITFVLDCDFDDLMQEHELKSLAGQITRCYSDNRNAHLRAHLVVSSFGGKLKERFDGVLAKHHESWKGVRFLSEDFVQVAEKAKEWMKGKDGGELAGFLQRQAASDDSESNADAGEVIYLSSEGEVTLDRLNPYSTYIIGGLVDHNRHKGLCHKRAKDRGIKTARLPIGEFLQMNSRAVLATNHVSEIMLRWLELGSWGDAFMEVIPSRKGGTLRAPGSSEGQSEDGQGSENQGDMPIAAPSATEDGDGVAATPDNPEELAQQS